MNESTKRKEEQKSKRGKKNGQVLVQPVGVVETPTQQQIELEERKLFWKEAIESIKNESFSSIENAVDRIIELTQKKMGVVAAGSQVQSFMKEMLLDNEEVQNVIRSSLKINH